MTLPKILVVLGPTSSGKSSLAVETAKEFNGEIVSADSRQVYKGLTVGSGVIPKKERRDVPHYLIETVEPTENFSVALYKEKAEAIIDDILDRGKLPIVVGGTGFYIEAIVDGYLPPEVPPNPKLRKELEDESIEELFSKLEILDSDRANAVQKNNRRRLVRAIEIARALGSVPKRVPKPKYNALQIGLTLPKEELRANIEKRARERILSGWTEEVAHLLATGVDENKIGEFGLGYKIIADYLQINSVSPTEELITEITTAEWQYAKRQMTWFKRDGRIKWFDPEDRPEIMEEIMNYIIN